MLPTTIPYEHLFDGREPGTQWSGSAWSMLILWHNRLGVLCILLCIALGIANLFHVSIIILFSIICLYVLFLDPIMQCTVLNFYHRVSGFILIFIEIPLLLRICPTSSKFDAFIRRFTTNYMRAGIYGVMSLVQWLSLIKYSTSLLAAAVVLMLTAICYLIAGVKGQGFVGSKTLGGQGVAQMIV